MSHPPSEKRVKADDGAESKAKMPANIDYSQLKALPRSILEDLAYQAVQSHTKALQAARGVLDEYQAQKRKREEDLEKELTDSSSSGESGNSVSSDDDDDGRPPLTCKGCIVAQENDEPSNRFCYYCENRVCSKCGHMCMTCNSYWCTHCKDQVADDLFQEHCCHMCHFSYEDWEEKFA